MKRGQPLGFRQLLRRVGVEERIYRLGREGRNGTAEAPGPGIDLVHALFGQCILQRLPQVKRLAEAVTTDDDELATAASGVQTYPVVGLWPVRLRQVLHDALTKEGVRKVDAWTRRFRRAIATFPAEPVDPFFNANTPEQLAEAERLAALHPDI